MKASLLLHSASSRLAFIGTIAALALLAGFHTVVSGAVDRAQLHRAELAAMARCDWRQPSERELCRLTTAGIAPAGTARTEPASAQHWRGAAVAGAAN
ncbi:MAG: hypothetical protein ABI641_08940 [Caldimonas sp.]